MCVLRIPCFLMCVLFCFSFIWLHVYAFAFESKVHCGSASARRFWASSILHTTCARSWCNWSASCVAAKQNTQEIILPPSSPNKQTNPSPKSVRLWGVQRHAQVDISWVSSVDSLFKQSWLHCLVVRFDVIFATYTSITTNSTPTVCTIHVRDHTNLALCICCVCFAKIWWWCVNNFPESGTSVLPV